MPMPTPVGSAAPSVRHTLNACRLRQPLTDIETVERLAQTFATLGDTARLRIIEALSQAEFCVGDLAEATGLTQSCTSHHLRVLRDLRLVKRRRDGRMIYYSLDDRHIELLFAQGLEHVREAR